jgi:hypothetical protein
LPLLRDVKRDGIVIRRGTASFINRTVDMKIT